MVQSNFKRPTLVSFYISLFLLALLFIAIVWFQVNSSGGSVLLLMLILLPVILIFVWLIWGELRKNILRISIENDRIKVTNFQGVGVTTIFYFSEIDGFKTSVLPSEYKDYEYLYIIRRGQKIVTVAEFYYKNYAQLKLEISKKCRPLGTEKFNVARKFKELFS